MQAVSLGHAGILVRAGGVTIACDPWFIPAFLGSWFVFPRNDRLPDELMDEVRNADFLYVSHLHGDHFDADFLRDSMGKSTTVLLPDYPTREMEREFNALGFRSFERTVNGVEREIAPGVTIAIHTETSITDGPGGDSALVVSDGSARLVNQNDCRTGDLGALAAHGPVDLHWLQFSGAIWYPMVYEMDPDEKKRLCRDKVDSQFARAIRYVEALDARTVVPSAGPPAFLDPDLFGFNMITGEETSIFPDQTEFQRRLADAGRHNAVTTIPGTMFTVSDDMVSVEQPVSPPELERIFSRKAEYLAGYQADWSRWLAALKSSWDEATSEPAALIESLRQWWEPLLAMAPILRSKIGANCVILATDSGSPVTGIYIDFVNGRIVPYDGSPEQPYDFRFSVDRRLLAHVVERRSVDWSNSLFLSCRFTAWRAGEYNEYLYNFFKSLSVERMNRTEAEARTKADRPDGTEADVLVGDFIVQRRCPHRNADLSVFGEIDGNELVCTLHGWRFDVETGACRNAAEKKIRIRRADRAS